MTTDLQVMGAGLSRLIPDDEFDLWVAREAVIDRLIKNAGEREIFKEYILHLANGGKTTKYMDKHGLIWTDLCELIWKGRPLHDLTQIANKVGEVFRKQSRIEEAHRRATEGVDKAIYHQGKICGYVREYSDQLLIMLIKADEPERFTDRKTVTHQGTTLHFHVDGIDMPDF